MPRLSPSFRALMGVGETIPSVDGRAFPHLLGGWSGREREGSHCWLSKDEFVIQDTSLGYARVVAVHADTGAVRVLATRPATQVVAAEGVWACWDDTLGYQDNFERQRPPVPVTADWFPLDAYDGGIVIKPVYHGPDGVPRIWRGPMRPVDVAPPRLAWECGYVKGQGLCAWPTGDRTRGVVLSGDGRDFRPDVAMLPDGRVLVVSSYGAQELPHELRRYEIDLPTRTFRFTPSPGQPWIEVPFEWTDLTTPVWADPDPPCDVPEFRPATHPIRVEVFGAPGFNLALGTQHDDPSITPWGVFCTMERDDVTAAITKAAALDVPVFAYTDSDRWDGLSATTISISRVGMIPTVQCYPSGSADAIMSSLARAEDHGGDIAIVVAAYRQIRGDGTYNWRLPDVLQRLRDGWNEARKRPVSHVLIFHHNRADRRDGVVSRPEFIEAVRRIREAAEAYRPSAPQPTPPPTPNPIPTPPVAHPGQQPPTRHHMDTLYAVKYDKRFIRDQPGMDAVQWADAIGEQERFRLEERPDKRFDIISVVNGRRLIDRDAHGLALTTETDTWPWVGAIAPSGERFAFRYDLLGSPLAHLLELVEVPA